MPGVLANYANHPYTRDPDSAQQALKRDRVAIHDILTLLRARTKQDFSGYKKPTVMRRIQRRMGLHQINDLTGYAAILRENASEAQQLADDLVIHVSGFFRDAPAWESLFDRVIKPLVNEKPSARASVHGSWPAPEARKRIRWPCSSPKPPTPSASRWISKSSPPISPTEC